MLLASRFRITLTAGFILLIAVTAASWLTLRHIQKIEQVHAREVMSLKLADMTHDITLFNQDVQRSLLGSTHNDLFTDYFNLPETKKGNRYAPQGHLLFSPKQEDQRKKMEHWVLSLHRRFPIAETCIIDRTGQEHLRINGGVVATTTEFSSEESDSIFFQPTFLLNGGQTFRSSPYMSPDANAWVIAFTSPIQLADNSKPAFYHIEIPLTVYQRVLRFLPYLPRADKADPAPVNDDRYLIVNQGGLVIADSATSTDYTLKPERNPQLNPNLPDFLPPEKLSDYAPRLLSLFPDPSFQAVVASLPTNPSGYGEFQHEGRHYRILFNTLPEDTWRVATILSADSTGSTLPPRTLLAAALLIVLTGIAGVALLAGRAYRPPF